MQSTRAAHAPCRVRDESFAPNLHRHRRRSAPPRSPPAAGCAGRTRRQARGGARSTRTARRIVRRDGAGAARRRAADGRRARRSPSRETLDARRRRRRRACRRRRRRSSRSCSRCSRFAPARLVLARLSRRWPTRAAPRCGAFLDRWRDSRFVAAALRVRRAAPARVRRVVRQPARVAGDRLSRPADARDERTADARRSTRSAPASRAAGTSIDASRARARPDARMRRRHRRHRRRRRHRGGDPRRRAGLSRRDRRGRAAALVARLPHARGAKPIPQLYQESAARKTADKAINILQGRCVGGGTTVNWTSSFRTPPATLAHWQRASRPRRLHRADARAVVRRMEARSTIAPWTVAPNANNDALRAAPQRSASRARAIRRNVKGCWNLGYCGMGCPTNAKQSMLVTTIPAALDRGATLVTRARARALRASPATASRRLECVGARRRRHRADRRDASTCARASFIAAGGAIGTPALLLRSGAPDPHALRRQAHVPASDRGLGGADAGARRRLCRRAADGLLRPLPRDACRSTARSASSSKRRRCIRCSRRPRCRTTARAHARWMRELPRHAGADRAAARRLPSRKARAARVRLRDDGSPVLDYPLTTFVLGRRAARVPRRWRRSSSRPARSAVMPVHGDGAPFTSLRDGAGGDRRASRCAPLVTRVVTAHVMGGCAARPRRAHVASSTRRRAPPPARNLYVCDGSLFPTIDRRQSAAVDLRDRRRALATRWRDGLRDPRPERFSVIALDRPRYSDATSRAAVRRAHPRRSSHAARECKHDPPRRRRRCSRLAPGLARRPRRRRRHARLGARKRGNAVPLAGARKAPLVESRTMRFVGDRVEDVGRARQRAAAPDAHDACSRRSQVRRHARRGSCSSALPRTLPVLDARREAARRTPAQAEAARARRRRACATRRPRKATAVKPAKRASPQGDTARTRAVIRRYHPRRPAASTHAARSRSTSRIDAVRMTRHAHA